MKLETKMKEHNSSVSRNCSKSMRKYEWLASQGCSLRALQLPTVRVPLLVCASHFYQSSRLPFWLVHPVLDTLPRSVLFSLILLPCKLLELFVTSFLATAPLHPHVETRVHATSSCPILTINLSAGLSLVGMYPHWFGLESSLFFHPVETAVCSFGSILEPKRPTFALST